MNVNNLMSNVKDLLQQSGFNDVWLFPESVNAKILSAIFKTSLFDISTFLNVLQL
jgi:hypothetical protein